MNDPSVVPDKQPPGCAAASAPPAHPAGEDLAVDAARAHDSATGPHPAPGKRGLVSRAVAHLNREDRPLLRDGLLAVVAIVATALLAVQQAVLDDRRADRQDALENTRFVRSVALDPDARDQPFGGLYLAAAQLAGLDLSCRDPDDLGTCADFYQAELPAVDLFRSDLSGADLGGANLTGASVRFANLANANLAGANLAGAKLEHTDLAGARLNPAYLVGADLSYADLTNADLSYANLAGANLAGADLAGTILNGVCYDEATNWPDGFRAPADPDCP